MKAEVPETAVRPNKISILILSILMKSDPFIAQSSDYNCVHKPYVDLAQRAKDLQKIKKKTKIPRVIDEGWNSQKQPSGQVEKKRRRKLLYPPSITLTRFSYL